jgi:hypothetical protein
MPLPSFYQSSENASAWNVVHAAGYGAIVGALAALFKTLGPLYAANAAASWTGSAKEIAGAALVFALLFAGAATLRNFLARRVVWHDRR